MMGILKLNLNAISPKERNKVTTVRWGMQVEKVLNLPCAEEIFRTVEKIQTQEMTIKVKHTEAKQQLAIINIF